MEQQLPLIEDGTRTDEAWRLDDRTREAGRRGVEAARQALRIAARQAARAPHPVDHAVGGSRQAAA